MDKKIWQPRWWSENPERWRWAGTIVLVIMLTGAFAYQNPQIWQHTATPQTAAEDTGAILPEPQVNQFPMAAERRPAGQPLTVEAEAQKPSVATKQPATAGKQTLVKEQGAVSAGEDEEPAGMQQLEAAAAVAVSAAPAGWQQPGYGVWTRGYGYGLDPTQGDYRFHQGCDMDLAVGSPVFAAAAGKVLLAATDATWGGLVIMEHGGGWRSIYKGLQPEVGIGATVIAGEQIGVILPASVAEQAQGSHLHFEMEVDSEKQDPLKWL